MREDMDAQGRYADENLTGDARVIAVALEWLDRDWKRQRGTRP